MVIRMIEEGIPLATVARISDLPVGDLEALRIPGAVAKVASEEELGAKAARLAYLALEEGERILARGAEPTKVRLILGLAQHPMRRMTTDQGEQEQEMQRLLHLILTGGGREIEEDEPEEVSEDGPGGD
jgi:hypothetical protein